MSCSVFSSLHRTDIRRLCKQFKYFIEMRHSNLFYKCIAKKCGPYCIIAHLPLTDCIFLTKEAEQKEEDELLPHR